MLRLTILLSCVLNLSGGLALAQQTLHVDPSQSQVHFSLTASMHNVEGTFKVQSGTIAFADHGGSMSGSVVVDAASGNSGEPKRDKKMTDDQMKASTFAAVTFAPKGYTGDLHANGDSDINVSGVFTLLGQPHEISVPMKVHRDGDHLKAEGSFTVPFVSWGMKDPSGFMLKVGKEVTVQVVLDGSVTH